MDLVDRLLADVHVIFAHAAPFLEKWAKCSKDMHPIFGIRQPFGSSRSKQQSILSCLHLLVAMLAEQRGQVSS